jgi:hypothetical protein
MLKLGTVRFRARCARHPRYNPAIDGEAAIRGGCPKCHLLLDIFRAHRQLVSLMQQVKEANQNKTDATSAAERQLDLFSAGPHA